MISNDGLIIYHCIFNEKIFKTQIKNTSSEAWLYSDLLIRTCLIIVETKVCLELYKVSPNNSNISS